MAYKVWIDQDLCTGDGLCVEIAPAVFVMGDGSGEGDLEFLPRFAYVYDESGMKHMTDAVAVPDDMLDDVVDAADDCPGECIFIEEAA